MIYVKYLLGAIFAVILTACGGGGGSAGTINKTSGGTTSITGTSVVVPSISLSIVDSAENTVPSNAVGSGAVFYVKALVKDSNGDVVPNKLVNFSADLTIAKLAQSYALSDSSGVAKVVIAPTVLTASRAGNLIASAKIDGVAVSADLDYQTLAASITLTNLAIAQSNISALQSTAVSVEGRINGALAGNTPIVVNFSSSNGCGTFNPASASTNSSGIATTTYQSAAACPEEVAISASSEGAQTVTGTLNVTTAQAANVVFTSATVPLMVTSAATGGLKQSTLKFQVLNASGSGMGGQSVVISLGSAARSAGVMFSVSGSATDGNQTLTTDTDGYASIIVSSGSLPTPVVVSASLSSNSSISASSSGVSVTSGRPTQKAASLSATKLSIEAFAVDGVQSQLTLRVADRQGNPVPPGTTVNFVASHGLIQGACNLDALSQCTVLYTSQGSRPTNGRVAILAYMDGEESFVDLNGDNIWQSGESFEDVGLLYRDDDESLLFTSGEQTYPGGSTGASTCSGATTYAYPSVASTCDGIWSSNIRVRKQLVLALASTEAVVTQSSSRSGAGFVVQITDLKGNAMPTGTTVEAAVVTSGAVCKVTSVSPGEVRNSPNGGTHAINLDSATDCATVRVEVTVTPPSTVKTIVGF
jgi:protocatechuate 3,4-dioxygenase beta subunit